MQAGARGGRKPPPASIEARSSCHPRLVRWRACNLARSASRTSAAAVGAGWGKKALSARGRVSMRLARTARPPTPSASTWCSTTTSAALPSASPVTSTAAHNGAVRVSGAAITEKARSSSARSSPGAGHVTVRTWRETSNPGSSIQMGPPQPNGGRTSLLRSRGTAGIRSAISRRTRAKSSSSARSRIKITPNCCAAFRLSIARNARSVGLARSTTGSACRKVLASGPCSQVPWRLAEVSEPPGRVGRKGESPCVRCCRGKGRRGRCALSSPSR
jgi:hypothetical protein